MSGRTFVYADPHFYHQGMCRFLRSDGSKLRPWDNADEMSEWMIDEYNKLVSPDDRVYVLGRCDEQAGLRSLCTPSDGS